jgi:ferredoxin-fold anticodon binding domain-containing protein
MGNMSYCRFENTEADLEDCYDHIEETENMSESELDARERLIKRCVDIAIDFGHEVDQECVLSDE